MQNKIDNNKSVAVSLPQMHFSKGYFKVNLRQYGLLLGFLGFFCIFILWQYRFDDPKLVIASSFIISSIFLSFGIWGAREGLFRIVNLYALLVFLFLWVVIPYAIIDGFVLNLFYDPFYQDITLISTFSLFCAGFIVGIISGANLVNRSRNKKTTPPLIVSYPACLVLSAIAIGTSALVNPSASILFGGSYGSEESVALSTASFGMGQGVYNIILLILFADLLYNFNKKKLILFSCTLFIAVVWLTLLGGHRAESLGFFIGLFIMNKIALNGATTHTQFSVSLDKIFRRLLVILFPVAMLLGAIRSAPIESWISVIQGLFDSNDAYDGLFDAILVSISYVVLATWNDVIYSGLLFIYGLDNNIFNFTFLNHYWDILCSTLPVAIYPSRPPYLAIVIQNFGATRGGFGLPASFAEGGMFQMVIVSVFYGVLIEWLVVRTQGMLAMLICGVICTASFRAVLYGEESLYKYILTLLVVYWFLRLTGLLHKFPSKVC